MAIICTRRCVCALAGLAVGGALPRLAAARGELRSGANTRPPNQDAAPAAELLIEPQAGPRPLRWVASDLPPFAWQGPKGPEGYAYELAQLMALRLGRRLAVQFYPWARAVRMVEEGSAAEPMGVFPLARTPDREQKFRWLILLLHVHYALVGRAGRPALDLDGLRHRRVGVLRGSPIIKNLQAEHFSQIIEGKDYKDLLRMLQLDMLDAVYAGKPMLQAAMELHGYARSEFQIHAVLGDADLYMGCSLRLSDVEAERWLQVYQQLVADGSVARLQQRYFK